MEDSEKKTVMSDHMMDGKQFQFSKRNSYLYRKIKSLQQKTDSNEQEQREKFYSLLPSPLQQEREQHLVSEYFKYLSGVFKKIKQILRLLNSHPLFFVREFLIPCEWLICIQKFWNERGNFYAYVNGAVKFYQRNCPIKGHKREFLLFLRPVTERIEKIKLKDKKKTLPTRWSILLQNLWPWHNTHTQTDSFDHMQKDTSPATRICISCIYPWKRLDTTTQKRGFRGLQHPSPFYTPFNPITPT